MRDFFIKWFERLVGLVIILLGAGILLGAVLIMLEPTRGGFFPGLVALVAGAMYVVLVGGMLYLGLGIYQNTKRTAEAIEKLAMK